MLVAHLVQIQRPAKGWKIRGRGKHTQRPFPKKVLDPPTYDMFPSPPRLSTPCHFPYRKWQGGPGSVRFGYGSGVERFGRFQFSVPAVPLQKRFFLVSVQFNRKGWFRFLENGSGGSGSAFGFGQNGSDGSGSRFRFGS